MLPALLTGLMLACGSAKALESVTLQLKWRHQFQFAGYYAALEKGYFRDVGLDVKLVEAMPTTNVVEEVIAGRANYGVGTSELLLARRKAPVVALAVIFQHSPLILLAREDKAGNVHELAGQQVMVEAHAEELLAYLRKEGLRPELLRIQPHSQKISDLIDGKVTAMSAYSTTEPYLLRREGFRTIEFSPRAVGIDFYGDNLFTSQHELDENPDRAKAFRAASLRGWEYAISHQQEITDLILARYNTQGLEPEMLAFEASRIEQLMQSQVIEVGYMNPGRWQHIADIYAELEMQPRGQLPAEFLYSAVHHRVPAWLTPMAIVATLTIFTLSILVNRNFRLSRALKKEIAAQKHQALEVQQVNSQLLRQLKEIEVLQSRLVEQAIRDGMTGLFNRRYLDETLPREIARARRDDYPLALLMLDIDHFKRVNDTYGHAAGDEVIRAVANHLGLNTREGDIACRFGGEEFIIVLPRMGQDAALARAEKLRLAAAARPVQAGAIEIPITISLGVSVYPDQAPDVATLIALADQALYESKRAGRNRVTCFAEQQT